MADISPLIGIPLEDRAAGLRLLSESPFAATQAGGLAKGVYPNTAPGDCLCSRSDPRNDIRRDDDE